MTNNLARTIKPARFPQTFCSQCGGSFGPGNFGYSHCKDHGGTELTAKQSVDPSIYRFAEQLVIGSGNGPKYSETEIRRWRADQAQDLAEQIQQVYDDWLAVD